MSARVTVIGKVDIFSCNLLQLHAVSCSMSTDLIVIHVIDRNRSVKKDFLCQKKNVLEQMKYFEPHLLTPPTGNSTGEDGTDVDITVHCDARVFEWLVNYISGVDPPPRISTII